MRKEHLKFQELQELNGGFVRGNVEICVEMVTLHETNISHLAKRKIIFKYALSGGYVNSLEVMFFQRF